MLRNLFLTGTYRSGTTLLEKILTNHPQVFVCSQPLPNFYYKLKNDFHNQKNLNRYYPLNDLFNESEYTIDDVTSFTLKKIYSKSEVINTFKEMADYSGNYSKFLLDYSGEIESGSLHDIHQQSCLLAKAHFKNNENLFYIGSKEILCEEFIPYYLEKNYKIIQIYRDPRSIIQSVRKGNVMGLSRPNLFHIRTWRKSIAIGLQHREHPNFLFLKYEDLLKSVRTVLEEIATFLNLSTDFPNLIKTSLKDQSGKLWKGNSSFSEFDKINRLNDKNYLNNMDDETLEYIEFLCFPELKLLNYTTYKIKYSDYYSSYFDTIEYNENPQHSISNFFKTEKIKNTNLEKLRVRVLRHNKLDDTQKNQLFLYKSVYKLLKKALDNEQQNTI